MTTHQGSGEMQAPFVGVLGASSFVGVCVLRGLVDDHHQVFAWSRKEPDALAEKLPGIEWHRFDEPFIQTQSINLWICVAPIWVLPEHFDLMERMGITRIVALSSTSCITKQSSTDAKEQETVEKLRRGEAALREWAAKRQIECTILRPTLIYGLGRDNSVSEIIRLIERFGFFPLLGMAKGSRQPVHAEDVGFACVAALSESRTFGQCYNLSGGEVLTYRELSGRVASFVGNGKILNIPRSVFCLLLYFFRVIPRYRSWNIEMVDRMNCDLVFDHSDATRDFGFSPRPFRLDSKDRPEP